MSPFAKHPFRRRARAALPALALMLAAGCDFAPISNVGTEVEGLTGTLVTESGRPASGAWVRVYGVSPTVLARAASTSVLIDSTRTNASGAFQIKDLPEGHYNLAASVRRGDTTLALFLASLHVAGDTNIGTDTLYHSGTIILQARSGPSSVVGATCSIADSPWLTISDDAGVCILQGVAPGSYQITVTHPSYLKTITADITVVSADPTEPAPVDLIDTSATLLPPGVPTLVSPASNATGVDTVAGLYWSGPGIIGVYRIRVATDSLFQNLVVVDSMVLGDASVSNGAITGRGTYTWSQATTYYWRVTAANAAGSRTSATGRFTTRGAATSPGNQPRLFAHWDFNEANGPQALDVSGNQRHVMITGPATRVAGVQGTALQFSGSTVIEIADSLIPTLGSFTLAAWVWEAAQSKDQPIFDFCCKNGEVGLHLWTNTIGSSIVTPGKVYVNLRSSPPENQLFYTFASPLAAGSWNHVALTYNGNTRKGVIHVNGVKRDSLTLPPGESPTVSGALYLGRRSPATTDLQAGNYFTGRLDDVRIYSEALSADSIASLHAAFTSATEEIVVPASQDAGILAPAPHLSTPVGLHGNNNFGKLQGFGVGAYDVNTIARALVRFSMPQGITGARINKAVIRLTSREWIQKNVRRDTVRLEAHRVLRDWKEGQGATQDGTPNSPATDGVTGLERFWGAQDGSEDWSQKLLGLNDIDAGTAVEATSSRPDAFLGAWEFEITALARVWADNPTTNFGVVFTTDIPASNAEVWHYPIFHSIESQIAGDLKPQLLLSLGDQSM